MLDDHVEDVTWGAEGAPPVKKLDISQEILDPNLSCSPVSQSALINRSKLENFSFENICRVKPVSNHLML